MKVKDIMTQQVISIKPDETVETAARLMTRFGISSLLVKETEELQGILTERDVLIRVVASGRNPSYVQVSEVMTRNVIHASPELGLAEAGRLMIENRIKKLPVLDAGDRKLLGILSLTDLAYHQPSLIVQYKDHGYKHGEIPLKELLKREESQQLEFKASLRYNFHSKSVDPNIEYNCLKTICAMLNTDGGNLLIGVTDKKEVVGLLDDYRTLAKKDRDGFENFLVTQVANIIGNIYLRYISINFQIIYNHEICRVSIRPSPRPAFLSYQGAQNFYVRTGNSSRPFKIADAAKYMIERWPEILQS